MENGKPKIIPKDISHGVAQTFADDMAQVIEDDKGGLVKKLIYQEEEHEKEKLNLSPESKTNRFYMLFGLLFVLVSVGVFLYFFVFKTTPVANVQIQSPSLIFNDKNTFLEVSGLTKDQIINTVINEISTTDVKTGGVEGINLTENKNIIGFREFIKLIKSDFIAPTPSLLPDTFLMGMVNGNTKDFFMLIKPRSTVDVFDSMRSWEDTMFTDLQGFLRINLSTDTKYLNTKNFEDGVVGNKNARILYDNSNNIVLMYVYANDNSVIITGSQSAALEIMTRLASGKVAQ